MCSFFGLLCHNYGVDFAGEAGNVGLLMEPGISDCLLGLRSFNFALGGCEVSLEVRPWFFFCKIGVLFYDISAKDVGVCDDDESDVY